MVSLTSFGVWVSRADVQFCFVFPLNKTRFCSNIRWHLLLPIIIIKYIMYRFWKCCTFFKDMQMYFLNCQKQVCNEINLIWFVFPYKLKLFCNYTFNMYRFLLYNFQLKCNVNMFKPIVQLKGIWALVDTWSHRLICIHILFVGFKPIRLIHIKKKIYIKYWSSMWNN